MTGLAGVAQRAGEVLAQLGGEAAPGEVGAGAGLGGSGQARALGQLRERGLVEGPKNRVRLTPAGWAAFATLPEVGAGRVLDEQLAGWPYEHRAFLELLVSAVIARHHLGHERPEPHLAFMAIGGTGTGKSTIAQCVCRLFGWDLTRHRVFLDQETPGSVGGRREPGTQELQPSPFAALPFVLFDEWDNPDEQLRRVALRYFQGTRDVQVEGQLVAYRPTPMLAANPPRGGGRGRYDHLRPEYRRRSVVLDTGDRRRPELEAFHQQPPPGRPLLPLEQLVPPAARLHGDARRVLGLLHQALTPAGQDQAPPPAALELAVLGRAALLGPGADLRLAAYATLVAYLAVTETLDDGQVQPGWQLDLQRVREYLGAGVDASGLELAVRHSQQARQARAAEAATGRRRRVVEDLEVTEARAALRGELHGLAQRLHGGRGVPAEHRRAAAGLRAVLRDLEDRAGRQRSRGGVAEVEALAAEPMQRARELLAGIDQEREAKARQASEERERAKRTKAEARRIEQANRTALRSQQRAALAQCRELARHLERLYQRRSTHPTDRPLEQLEALRLVEFRPAPRLAAPARPATLAGVLAQGLTQGRPRSLPATGVWVSTQDPQLRWPGRPERCPALERWGPDTRRVLGVVLGPLHAQEDALVAALGLRARSRPVLVEPDRPALALVR